MVTISNKLKFLIMKNNIKLTMLVLCLSFLACDEIEHEPIGNDGQAPVDVSNVQLTPTNGGFDITYDLPEGKDILYVMAQFDNTKGNVSEVKASAFTNNLQILGLGDTLERTIKIFSVDRSDNRSNGIDVVGSPLTSIVEVVAETIQMSEAFGGIKISWVNNSQAPITLDIYAENEEGVLELVETVYTESAERTFALRGIDPVAQTFKVIVNDKYGNHSFEVFPDTPDQKLTPLREDLLDKALWELVKLDNDDDWTAFGSKPTNLWDENPKLNSGAGTSGEHIKPSILTIDLGVEVDLSRFTLNQRGGKNKWVYGHSAPLQYSIFGSLENPGQDGNLDDWIRLIDCVSIKPSGLPVGTNTDEDNEQLLIGDEWEFPEVVKVRYIRVAVYTSWGAKSASRFREFTVWGQIN